MNSSDSKSFTRLCVAVNLPKLGDEAAVRACVERAQMAWGVICSMGIGSKQKGEPRRAEDYYAALSPDQRRDFDQFWKAFGWKNGKQDAARIWKQINPDHKTVEHILYAARKTAETRDTKNSTPKWAQGWLSERRWTDWDQPKPKDTAQPKDLGKKRHIQEMAAMCRLQGNEEGAKALDKQAGEL